MSVNTWLMANSLRTGNLSMRRHVEREALGKHGLTKAEKRRMKLIRQKEQGTAKFPVAKG